MAGARTDRIDWSRLGTRFAVELGPALAFAIALQLTALAPATAIFMAAVAASTAFSWLHKGRFPVVPAALTALALVLGTLTIARGAASYIQLLPTIVNGSAAVAILGGLAFGRLFLRTALQDGFHLEERAWRRLSLRMSGYLVCIALLNEVVRNTVPPETWAWYKSSVPVLNALFLLANLPLIRAHLLDGDGRRPDGRARIAARSARSPAS